MTPNSNELSREELYKLVWTRPATRLAKELGVSDVAISKACKRHNVPRPPRGYWVKLELGKPVSKVELPPNTDPRLQTVSFRGEYVAVQSLRPPKPKARTLEQEEAAKIAHTVPVADRLSSPHPLVAATKHRMDWQPPDEHRIVHAAVDQLLDVHVSRNMVGRAMRLMDALLKYWQGLGGTIRARNEARKSRSETAFGMNGTEVTLTLREATKWEPEQKHPATFSRRTRHPTGCLTLTINAWHWVRIRSKWADQDDRALESCLGSVVQALLDHLEQTRLDKLDGECERRQEEQVEALRAQRERARKSEKKRRGELTKMMRLWRHATQIRRFIGLVRRQAPNADSPLPECATNRTWQQWAMWYADSLDPLCVPGQSPYQTKAHTPQNLTLGNIDLTRRTRGVLIALGIVDSDSMLTLTEKDIHRIIDAGATGVWREICRVLEAMGYDTSGREYWL